MILIPLSVVLHNNQKRKKTTNPLIVKNINTIHGLYN